MRLRQTILGLLVLAVILTACGSSKPPPATTTTTTEPRSTASAADTAIAQQLTITESDLPTGWTANTTPETSQINISQIGERLNDCVTVGSGEQSAAQQGTYIGDQFAQKGQTITSTVAVLATPELARQKLQGLRNPKTQACIAGLFEDGINRGLSRAPGDINASSSIAPIPGITTADNQLALRISTHITSKSIDQTLFSDLLAVAQGRFVVSTILMTFQTPPDPALEQQLLDRMQTRATAALR